MTHLNRLPADLPVPVDDGAADHPRWPIGAAPEPAEHVRGDHYTRRTRIRTYGALSARTVTTSGRSSSGSGCRS